MGGEPRTTRLVGSMRSYPYLKPFFVLIQFLGTQTVLSPVRRPMTQWCAVWIIQITAFLATLQRKGFFGRLTFSALYAVVLFLGALCSNDHLPQKLDFYTLEF